MTDMKREFKDLIRFEQYDFLNSEITGDYDKIRAGRLASMKVEFVEAL